MQLLELVQWVYFDLHPLICRLAFKGHDVNFSKKKDPVEPMSTLENKQFKMFNVSGFDYSNASARHIEANKYRD